MLAPRPSEDQRQAIAAAEANPIHLEEHAVVEVARSATGLSDFGPDAFRERMRRLIDEWNADARAYAIKRGF